MEKEYRRLQLMAYGMIGVVAAVILVSVLRRFYLTLILMAAALFFQIFVFRRKQREYSAQAMRRNLQKTVCRLLNTDRVITDPGREIPEIKEELVSAAREAGFFRVIEKPGAVSTFVTVDGTYKKGSGKMHVTSADMAIHVPVEGTRISADVLTGNWIRIRFPEDRFPDPETLPESFHSRLASLKRYTPGKVYLHTGGRTADIFLQDRFLDAGFSPRSAVTGDMLARDPLPELKKILEMFEPLARQQEPKNPRTDQ